jgi:hypothetical protein
MTDLPPRGPKGPAVPVVTPVPSADRLTKALEFFKDWTNYLLVTTVAAIGWVSAQGVSAQGVIANHPKLKFICLAALGLSAIFGILTQALVPLVQEQRREETSNYQVPVTFWFWPTVRPLVPLKWGDGIRLTWMCFPQHTFLIIGIALYVYAAWPEW